MEVWDEADNALVILESADAGHPFQLQRGGEPYFDKPPLWYWLTSLLVMALGPVETAFRLVSALSGLLLVGAVMVTAGRLYSLPAAAASGLFLLAVRQLFIPRPSELFSTHHLRSADSDALMMLLAFGAFAALAARVRGRSWGLPVAAALTGLGLMAKGPPALMPLVAFLAWQLVSRRRVRLHARESLWSVGILLLVTVPWHAAMAWTWGDAFLDRYPRYVLFRVSEGLSGHSPEPGYYLRVLSNHRVFFGLELTLLAAAAALADRRRAEFRRSGPLLTLAVTLAGLQLSRTKIAWYVLPLYPYGALLVAALADRLREAWAAPAAGRRGRAAALAGGLALAVWMGPFAARNLYTVVRMQTGSVQRFFTRVVETCGRDTAWADSRDSLHVRFLLRRYGIDRGGVGEAACAVLRIDAPGADEAAPVVAEGAGFLAVRTVGTAGPDGP
jgi:4-amino-4-deoxy-L-arabinose transferase-like glycosyltransferase